MDGVYSSPFRSRHADYRITHFAVRVPLRGGGAPSFRVAARCAYACALCLVLGAHFLAALRHAFVTS